MKSMLKERETDCREARRIGDGSFSFLAVVKINPALVRGSNHLSTVVLYRTVVELAIKTAASDAAIENCRGVDREQKGSDYLIIIDHK